jgi:hypothetical protein
MKKFQEILAGFVSTPKKEPIYIKENSQPTHVHNWELFAKTFAPPRKDVQINNVELQEKALFGVTTLLWKCACGEFKKEEMPGSDENTLDELMTKADTYGPQYIQVEGKIYSVARYIAPSQQPENVPLR